MWAMMVVVGAPFLDDVTGMPVASEQMLVEALVTQPAVEALHKAVLHRFARRDVVPLDTAILLPGEHGV